MLEMHVSHTRPWSRMQSLSESPGESKVIKPIFSNSGKHYSLPESLRIFVFSRIFIKANKIIFLKHGIFWGFCSR